MWVELIKGIIFIVCAIILLAVIGYLIDRPFKKS